MFNILVIVLILTVASTTIATTIPEVPYCRLRSPKECLGKRRVFVERFGTANPFSGIPMPTRAYPVHHDFDSDGDIDLLVGGTKKLFYLENVGTAMEPKYTAKLLLTFSSPSGNSGFNSVVVPTLFDLDNDGLMDFILFGRKGHAIGPYGMKYYKNIGNKTFPKFDEWNLSEAEKEIVYGFRESADLQQAWSLELNGKRNLVGNGFSSSGFHYFENNGGSPTRFLFRTGVDDPLHSFENDCAYASLTSFDMDNDGDNDIVVSCSLGVLQYLENTGSNINPSFTKRRGASNPLSKITRYTQVHPDAFDVDGDGDVDIILGMYDTGLHYLENTSPSIDLQYQIQEESDDLFQHLKFELSALGVGPTPCAVDFDSNPNTLELIVGGQDGKISYVQNYGSTKFIKHNSSSLKNPLRDVAVGSWSAPGVWDIDGDKDQDVIVANGAGALVFVENVGNATHAQFLVRDGNDNPFKDIALGANTQFSPSGVDIDDDGDIDFISATLIGNKFRYWENIGTRTNALYTERVGIENPFRNVIWATCCRRTSAKQVLYDMDQDKDMDLIVTGGYGYFYYYENTGNKSHPLFKERSIDHPLGHLDAGGNLGLTIISLDGEVSFLFFYCSTLSILSTLSIHYLYITCLLLFFNFLLGRSRFSCWSLKFFGLKAFCDYCQHLSAYQFM